MRLIWDTGALSLFFADHSEAKEYMRKVVTKQVAGYIPRLILAEFFYKCCQKFGKEVAQVRLVALRQVPLIEEPIKEVDVLEIGILKTKHPELSLADCVLVQLAKKKRGTLLTTEEGITQIKGVKVYKFEF
ncbi:MAG: type II toxin-antitoxin system VapC family toxin [Candidatus Heimdallarchaeota archaeon]|nr:type II toxin-antitoxin system VapC family toxin [Candidatus Heimdallarchaeota archaeon]